MRFPNFFTEFQPIEQVQLLNFYRIFILENILPQTVSTQKLRMYLISNEYRNTKKRNIDHKPICKTPAMKVDLYVDF